MNEFEAGRCTGRKVHSEGKLDRAELRSAMQALLAFDVSAIPLEADLDPSRAPTS